MIEFTDQQLMELVRNERRRLASYLLDQIKYGGSDGDDDSSDLTMLITELLEIEEKG